MCLFLLAPSAHEKKNHLKPDTSVQFCPPHPTQAKVEFPTPGRPSHQIPLSPGTESRPMPRVRPVGEVLKFRFHRCITFRPKQEYQMFRKQNRVQ